MGLPNVMHTGRSGMVASRAAIATTGHNIANTNTEGYSRQRVDTEANVPTDGVGRRNTIGQGVKLTQVSRVNDEYVEKELRNGTRDLGHYEEKGASLRQLEDVFNELNGDGLNRLMSRFFNEFRKLGNDPNNEAIRQSVREATQALVTDFHRLRQEVESVQQHIDSRISGYAGEINSLTTEIRDLNQQIKAAVVGGGSPNDLMDNRDVALKKLSSFFDVSVHKDKDGALNVDIRGVGPLITGPQAEAFSVARSPADEHGKPENALDIKTSASASSNVTHRLRGGKLGALVEVRDKTLSGVLSRLDDLAYSVSSYVNEIHKQGVTRDGFTGVDYFKGLQSKERASEKIGLSDAIASNTNNIAAAFEKDAPGDNRVALAISQLQFQKLMNDGQTTADDWYNSIVSDIGVVRNRNESALGQTKNIMTNLERVRDQISGVSLDEETANLLQFQHAFAASAKVITVADQLLDEVLAIRR